MIDNYILVDVSNIYYNKNVKRGERELLQLNSLRHKPPKCDGRV